MNGLLGKKIGMTRVYAENGHQVPVTVLEVGPCVAVQRKTLNTDGYEAVQLGFGEQKESRLSKAQVGRFKKASTTTKRSLQEFRVESDEGTKAGDLITAAIFEGVPFVDVTSTTKGRGFQGVVKRHSMRGGPGGHGSTSHRRVGAIGCRAIPGRVHKGKRMPGHMGNVTVTTQNLKVIQVVTADNMMLVRGAVPGPAGSLVRIVKALKKTAVKS